MSFASVMGHQPVIGGLRAAHANNRVSHAYIFSGPDGVGKQRVAMAFVKMLACSNDSISNDSCGTCRPCRLFDDERHPDLTVIEPDGKFIKIEQVRGLRRALRYPPVEAPIRAILIHQAEAFHPAAANALLKTLEEPSAKTIFILITSQPNTLLTTIRSRCQEIRFTNLERNLVAEWLQEHEELDAVAADEIAAISGGSLGTACQLADPELVELRQHWLTVLSQLPNLSTSEVIQTAESMSSTKKSLPFILDVLRTGFRDILLISCGLPASKLTFRRRINDMPILNSESVGQALSQIDVAEQALVRNVNPRLTSEMLLFQLKNAMNQT